MNSLVSAENSLPGSNQDDRVGRWGITELSDGNDSALIYRLRRR